MILKSDKVKVVAYIQREEKHTTKTDIDAKTETVHENQIRRKFIPYIMREEKHTIKTDIDAKTKTVLENQIRRKVVPYHERRKTRNKN